MFQADLRISVFSATAGFSPSCHSVHPFHAYGDDDTVRFYYIKLFLFTQRLRITFSRLFAKRGTNGWTSAAYRGNPFPGFQAEKRKSIQVGLPAAFADFKILFIVLSFLYNEDTKYKGKERTASL